MKLSRRRLLNNFCYHIKIIIYFSIKTINFLNKLYFMFNSSELTQDEKNIDIMKK